MGRDFNNEYLKDKDVYPNTFEAALKYMNYYHTLNKPVGYKKPHRKNQELGLEFAQHVRGKAKGQKQKYNNNGESHFFQYGSEYNWANNCPELSKEQKRKMHVQFENEELEEEDDGDKIVFVQVALYQVNGVSDEEDSEN